MSRVRYKLDERDRGYWEYPDGTKLYDASPLQILQREYARTLRMLRCIRANLSQIEALGLVKNTEDARNFLDEAEILADANWQKERAKCKPTPKRHRSMYK